MLSFSSVSYSTTKYGEWPRVNTCFPMVVSQLKKKIHAANLCPVLGKSYDHVRGFVIVQVLAQHVSKFKVHANHLVSLLKCRLSFSRTGVVPKNLYLYHIPG